jgi:hypothetical protein
MRQEKATLRVVTQAPGFANSSTSCPLKHWPYREVAQPALPEKVFAGARSFIDRRKLG